MLNCGIRLVSSNLAAPDKRPRPQREGFDSIGQDIESRRAFGAGIHRQIRQFLLAMDRALRGLVLDGRVSARFVINWRGENGPILRGLL